MDLDKPAVTPAYDQTNGIYGTGTTFIASTNVAESWCMRREFLSSQYNTAR